MQQISRTFLKNIFKFLFLFICFSAIHASKNNLSIVFPDTFDIDLNLNAPEFKVVGPINHSITLVLMDPSENNVIYVLRKGSHKGDTISWNALEYMLRDCFCGRSFSLHAFNDAQKIISKSVRIINKQNPCPKLTKKVREEYIESEYNYPWLVPELVADSTIGWVKTMWNAYPNYPSDEYVVESGVIVKNRRIVRLLASQPAKRDPVYPLSLTLKSPNKLHLGYTLKKFSAIHLIVTSPKDNIDATVITLWSPNNLSSGILEIPMSWIHSLFPIGSSIGLLAVQGENRSNSIWISGNDK
jgi:hypothetical protein